MSHQDPPAKHEPAAAGYPQQPPPVGFALPPGQYGAPSQPGQYGAPPSQPGQYGAPPSTVVYTNPSVVVHQPNFGPQPGAVAWYSQSPALIVCQHCQATVTTTIDPVSGLMTWLIAGVICIVGCWLGCCLIPFCIDSCKDTRHACPNCHQVVGIYKQIR